MGDLHQPLHAASWYNKDFPDGDRGGNSEVVNTPGGVLRLHAFWDEALGHNDDADSITDHSADGTIRSDNPKFFGIGYYFRLASLGFC